MFEISLNKRRRWYFDIFTAISSANNRNETSIILAKETPILANKNMLSEDPKEHILVIRLSAMGDVAMTVPVLRTFRAAYPDVQITVLTRKFFEPIFSDIDNVQVYHADVDGKHKGVLGLSRLSKELRGLGITIVADLHNVCLLYTSPSPRDKRQSRMPSSA